MIPEEMILQTLRDNPKSTAYKIAKIIGVAWSTIDRRLLQLAVEGKVRSTKVIKIGKDAETWEIVEQE